MEENLQYDEKIRPIRSIEFNILGNDEIKRITALGKDSTGIEIPDLYDNMEPKRGGLIDTRLGTTINSLECATCGFDSANCIGHFGHIDLAEPAFHLGFLQTMKKILSCVCLKCSKLLIYKTEDEIIEMLKNTKSNKAKLNLIREITKSATYCAKPNVGCSSLVTKIKIETKKSSAVINIVSESEAPVEEGEATVVGENVMEKKKVKQILTPEICYDILRNISDTDCMIMGLDPKKSRPENMIHKIFPVSPVAIRPSAKVDFLESSTKEDDLTHKLADIVKANVRIRKFKESANDITSKYGMDHQHLLQFHIYTNFDNESAIIPKSEQRNKSATKSLSSRLKGKEGRIRCNLQGKRVNFSGRTVITGDPTTDVDQLRVPIRIATNLTKPEVVTPQNIDRLTELVKNGRDKYPGANFVFQASNINNGKKMLPIDLRYRKERVDLRFGDIVERHIVDGDIVLLNRQPTLHKLSMMGFKIKVINNPKINTFGLNVLACKPFNADFDGDKIHNCLQQRTAV